MYIYEHRNMFLMLLYKNYVQYEIMYVKIFFFPNKVQWNVHKNVNAGHPGIWGLLFFSFSLICTLKAFQ